MKNKFFFGVVGFFLVCLFVLFASVVGRAAVVTQVGQVESGVIVSSVSQNVSRVTVNDVVQDQVYDLIDGQVLVADIVQDVVISADAIEVPVRTV